MDEQEKYWQQIRQFVRDQFGMPGEVYDIVFLIGVREMGYGFQQLDQDTKTKVFNFASIYLMNFMSGEEREKIRSKEEGKPGREDEPSNDDKGHENEPPTEVNGDWDSEREDQPSTEDSGNWGEDSGNLEEQIYKQAIINYFREKKIL